MVGSADSIGFVSDHYKAAPNYSPVDFGSNLRHNAEVLIYQRFVDRCPGLWLQ